MEKENNQDVEENNQDVENEEIESEDVIPEEEEDSQLEKLSKEKEELIDKLQRSLAEFDNFRKRTEKEKTTLYDMGISDAIVNILPVIDNFERAINSFQDKDDVTYEGFKLIIKQLLSKLHDMGVEPIECIGKEFDIDYHHAIAKVDSDEVDSNHIVEEVQKGYIYKDKVLRFSMVSVAN